MGININVYISNIVLFPGEVNENEIAYKTDIKFKTEMK